MTSRIKHLLQTEGSRPVRVTILYEDLPTAMRAKSLFECLTVDGELPARMKTDFWRFDFLSDGDLRKKAAKLAARSAVVILSAQNQRGIRPEVECCVNEWLQNKRRQPCAFAILLAAPNQPTSYSRTVLGRWQHLAREKRMDFFCELPEWELRAADAARVSPSSIVAPANEELIRGNLRVQHLLNPPALKARNYAYAN